MKKTGKAAAASALFGAGYLLADSRPDFPVEKKALGIHLKYAIDDPILAQKLAVARDDSPARLVERALLALGGIGQFVSKGDRVVIKPNVGWDRVPEQAANTNPEAVAQMVRMCLAAGAREVIVTDVTCNDQRRTFLRSGIQADAEKAGAKVPLSTDSDFTEIDLGGQVLTVWPVLRHMIEADKFINMPIAKHHSLTGATLGMKNLYGIIGGRRNQLHQKIDQSIVDLATFMKPTLVVADCYRVLMRNGPVGGNLDDVKECRAVVAGIDQVAVDAYLTRFLDKTPEDVSHIALAHRAGLGGMNLDHITILDG
ncbi:MAG: DUF362 domain-containing protein [candidate division Zixibacteria bacterium]|nr:DUF362 domain-containing protein [candidate division Zixibacteria bacterium]MBU1472022.1 DUF362 domain-containing protein [candidate division Zixibacteria bacterium]MBU2624045.1 DUF362 domain-containing protein [candidate division Zixibacteria bacterium]